MFWSDLMISQLLTCGSDCIFRGAFSDVNYIDDGQWFEPDGELALGGSTVRATSQDVQGDDLRMFVC